MADKDVMRPRALGELTQTTMSEAFPILAEGLPLLADHVDSLANAMAALTTRDTVRGHQVLNVFATEEAAKILIILDMARCGWNNSAAKSRLLKAFYNHVLRHVYAQVHQGSPADYAEVAEYVEALSATHYLDGPNDVDWIFRNHLEATREDTLYVDRVAWGDGNPDTWVTPLDRADLGVHDDLCPTVELVQALRRLGVLSLRGLEVCQEVWAGEPLVWERRGNALPTRWEVCQRRNRDVFRRLSNESLLSPDLTDRDVDLGLNQWTFPLGHLDLTVKKVPLDELRDTRERALSRMNAGY